MQKKYIRESRYRKSQRNFLDAAKNMSLLIDSALNFDLVLYNRLKQDEYNTFRNSFESRKTNPHILWEKYIAITKNKAFLLYIIHNFLSKYRFAVLSNSLVRTDSEVKDQVKNVLLREYISYMINNAVTVIERMITEEENIFQNTKSFISLVSNDISNQNKIQN